VAPSKFGRCNGLSSSSAKAARRIRQICDSASPSADKVGVGGANKHEIECFKRAAKSTMEIAVKMDNLLRDSVVRQTVFLCMKANDLKTAEVLFRAVQAVSTRETALKDYPRLRSTAA
jgi:hypothetical protein